MNNRAIKSFLYQLRNDRREIAIYYTVLVIGYILIFVMTGITISNDEFGFHQSNGFGFSTAIFLFCACAFKEKFHLLMQNGVSRKSVYIGRIINSVVLSFILAVCDMFIKNVLGIIASLIGENFIFESLFEMMFNGYRAENNWLVVFLTAFLFFFALYLFFLTLGYLMSAVFYRLNKTTKVLFAAGIPIFMFVVYPVIDFSLFGGRITINLLAWVMETLGIRTQNPFIGVLSLLIGAGLFTALSWLPIRRARVE